MTKTENASELHVIDAPRIQVVLNEVGQESYEAWLVLHVPDGKSANTTRLSAPLNREDAIRKMLDIYTAIAEQFAFGDEEPPERPQ